MNLKTDLAENLAGNKSGNIVIWGENYATGIPLIDDQHRELVNLTNNLYRACLTGTAAVDTAFKEAMSRMVVYVRFHFTAELELLKKLDYPKFDEHKLQHDTLIRDILAAANEYKLGKLFIPHQFARTLRDWVFGHIAIYDKQYASYFNEKKKLLAGLQVEA